ncbi:MAG: ABC transporter permease [Candidatus Bipolaricaulota bacterium]|nr:ABC transporter permease [Candidatus Bipolaricaulota bacterium]
MKSVLSIIGLVILGALGGIAIFTPAPYDPHERVSAPFQPPSPQHWLGTNDIGQDIFSEVVHGTRTSLLVGVVAATLAILLGVVVGVTAGYAGRSVDTLLMRVVDVVLVVPFLPLMILLGAYLGPSLITVIAVIAALMWARPARVIRSQVLVLKNLAYVEAAHAIGGSFWHLLRRHIIPAIVPLAMAQLVTVASSAILIESSLAFLGLGDPVQKSWGTVLYYAQARGAFLTGAWVWWVLPPGALITLSVLGFALVGYALERRSNPRLRHH